MWQVYEWIVHRPLSEGAVLHFTYKFEHLILPASGTGVQRGSSSERGRWGEAPADKSRALSKQV